MCAARRVKYHLFTFPREQWHNYTIDERHKIRSSGCILRITKFKIFHFIIIFFDRKIHIHRNKNREHFIVLMTIRRDSGKLYLGNNIYKF
jgi:hypothetical protein